MIETARYGRWEGWQKRKELTASWQVSTSSIMP